jgi:membrane protein DedA with SNARE-associated domain
MRTGRSGAGGSRAVLLLLLLAAVPLLIQASLALLPPVRAMLPGGAGTLRMLAVAFLFCDLAISALLVTLLVLGDPQAAPLEDQPFAVVSRRLWRLLLGLAVLSYLGLTPLFLYLYLTLR